MKHVTVTFTLYISDPLDVDVSSGVGALQAIPTPPRAAPAAPSACSQRSGSSLPAIKKHIADKYHGKLADGYERRVTRRR
jgi:hypothetical protein